MTDRLPPPPKPLPALADGDDFVAPPASQIGRIYFRGGAWPSAWNSFRSYGPVARMRFDHHPLPRKEHPERAVSYASPSLGAHGPNDPLIACVLECFGQARVIDTLADDPWFTVWRPTAPLRLLDVVDGPWITRAGGNGAISSGPRAVARDWSRAIYRSYPTIHGIYYETSSVPMFRSVVLYERARALVPARPGLAVPLRHPGLQRALRRIATTYALDLLP